MGNDILRMEGVTFCYHQRIGCLFSNITLGVRAGSFVALLGRSGTGKTTLLNLLAGYLVPSAGACLLGSSPILGPGPSRIPIFQEDSLWPWLSAMENVTLHALLNGGRAAAKAREAEAEAILMRAGLPPQSHRKYPKELSAGMKKRVEIARALLAGPDIILADEPFATLDPETRNDLHELMQGIWRERGTTILFSTHDLEEALYLASEIVVLRQVKSTTTVAGVFANPLQGGKRSHRDCPDSYYALHDQLLAEMHGDSGG